MSDLHGSISALPFNRGEFASASSSLIVESLERVRQRIIDNMHTTNRWASGKTADSMVVEQYEGGARLVGRPYFQSLEIGRPAGPVPKNMVSIIKKWIIDKGISPEIIPYKTNRQHKYTVQERSLNAMAGAITHTIATRGTSLYRQGGDESVYTPVIREEVEMLKAHIGALIVQQLTNN